MEVPSKFIFAPFRFNEWMLILISLFLVSVILVIFARVITGVANLQTFGDAAYDVIRSLIAQTHFFNPHLPPRIIFVCFEISVFFLVSFYTSYLTSSLLVSVKPKDPFTGYDQFAQLVWDNKYTLITDENPNKHVAITDKREPANPKEKMQMAYQWNPPVFVAKNDFQSIVTKIVENDTLVYYCSYYHLLHGTSHSCDVKVIVDTYTHPSWLAFAFPKGSKLQNLISTALHQDYTTVDGYLARLYNRYAKRRMCYSHEEEMGPSRYASFGVWEMQGAFVILANGILFAAIIWIIECLRFMCPKKKMIARNRHATDRERLFTVAHGPLVRPAVKVHVDAPSSETAKTS